MGWGMELCEGLRSVSSFLLSPRATFVLIFRHSQTLRLWTPHLQTEVPPSHVLDASRLSALPLNSHDLPLRHDSPLRSPPVSSNLVSLPGSDLRASLPEDPQLWPRVVSPFSRLEVERADAGSVQPQTLPSWRLWDLRRDGLDRLSLWNDQGSLLPNSASIHGLTPPPHRSRLAVVGIAPRMEASSRSCSATGSAGR